MANTTATAKGQILCMASLHSLPCYPFHGNTEQSHSATIEQRCGPVSINAEARPKRCVHSPNWCGTWRSACVIEITYCWAAATELNNTRAARTLLVGLMLPSD